MNTLYHKLGMLIGEDFFLYGLMQMLSIDIIGFKCYK